MLCVCVFVWVWVGGCASVGVGVGVGGCARARVSVRECVRVQCAVRRVCALAGWDSALLSMRMGGCCLLRLCVQAWADGEQGAGPR